jgi:hypothetical protein
MQENYINASPAVDKDHVMNNMAKVRIRSAFMLLVVCKCCYCHPGRIVDVDRDSGG